MTVVSIFAIVFPCYCITSSLINSLYQSDHFFHCILNKQLYDMCNYHLQVTNSFAGVMQQYGFLIYFTENDKPSVQKITKIDGTKVERDSKTYKYFNPILF